MAPLRGRPGRARTGGTEEEECEMASLSTVFELSGGFHMAGPIRIRVLTDLWGLRAEDIPTALDQWLTPYQRRRLERHFCGIPGCACGSWHRAIIRPLQTPIDR